MSVAQLAEHVWIRSDDIGAFVDDDLLDLPSGRLQLLGQHFATATGARQQESLSGRARHECRRQVFRVKSRGLQIGP